MIWLSVNQLGNETGIRKSGKNVAVVINKSAMTEKLLDWNTFFYRLKEGFNLRDVPLIVSQPAHLMKPDMVISPAALCSWIWLPAQTRALHVCLWGFPSGAGFLPHHRDMRASLTCKSLVNVTGTCSQKSLKTKRHETNQDLNDRLDRKAMFVFKLAWRLFIIDLFLKIETQFIDLLTGWQLQDKLSGSAYSTKFMLRSGWNRFTMMLLPAETSVLSLSSRLYGL